jgi:hypothetical protein
VGFFHACVVNAFVEGDAAAAPRLGFEKFTIVALSFLTSVVACRDYRVNNRVAST